MIKLSFFGGAGEVTGANYLIDNGKYKILVDCGMVQGSAELEQKNYHPFSYTPSEVSALFVTHSHLDHVGRIPYLVKEGFNGTIYSTYPTKELAQIVLEDNLNIMEHSKSHMPLYNEDHVMKSFQLWQGLEYAEIVRVNPDMEVRYNDAGHILGSGIVEIWVMDHQINQKKKIVFSGDLGNTPSVLLKHFEYIEQADYVLVESTYGDKIHEDNSTRKEKLRDVVKDVIKKNGVLLLPAFSIERTQDILFELNDLIENHSGEGKILGRVGKIDVYLDSPMAIKATKIYKKYHKYYNNKTRNLAAYDDIFNFPFLTFTEHREDSMRINYAPNPKMIIAGSGMSTGGRIQFHEQRYLDDPNNTILFVGYQSRDSLGHQIQSERDYVVIHGKHVKNAAFKTSIGGYSAHADQEMLLDWLSHIQGVKTVFVVQGEVGPAGVLSQKIKASLNMDTIVPVSEQTVELI